MEHAQPVHGEHQVRSSAGGTRLQKVLAQAGIASRRHAETLITAGRVAVNGRVVRELGLRVAPETDAIRVDGRPVERRARQAYLALYKPRGYVTTARDPQARATALSLVPPIAGLFSVGRLDVGSEGLLLLTTDGEWALRVSHPRFGCEKEYLVDVQGGVAPEVVERLRRPMRLAHDVRTSGAEVEVLDAQAPGRRLRIVLHEGRNRQIRRMLAHVGHRVVRLLRVRVGTVRLELLKPGEWRALTRREIELMRAAAPPPRRFLASWRR